MKRESDIIVDVDVTTGRAYVHHKDGTFIGYWQAGEFVRRISAEQSNKMLAIALAKGKRDATP